MGGFWERLINPGWLGSFYVCVCVYVYVCVCVCVCMCVCWTLLSNQSFYRQIASCGMGVGDHRVAQ